MSLHTSQFPENFLERLKNILSPENFQYYLDSLTREKMTSFRVNTLKISIADLITRLLKQNISPTPISWCAEGFYISSAKRKHLTETIEFKEGLIYIQNPSSMFASIVLDPKSQEEILDLAAAPGGKTLHLAALMGNHGRIAAVEAVKDRFFRLKNNVELSGANNVQLYHKDGASIGRLVPARFDRVLLDAPCSSEGRFDIKEPDTFRYWSEKKIIEMTRKQKKLIYSAVQALKPNGTLVYCTCSFAPEENEGIIQYILNKIDNLELEPISVPFKNYQSGLTAWKRDVFLPAMVNAVRIIPDDLMSGFFICKLRRTLHHAAPFRHASAGWHT